MQRKTAAVARQATQYIEWLAKEHPDKYELLLWQVHSRDVQPDAIEVEFKSAEHRARWETLAAAIRRRERGRARQGERAACDQNGNWQRRSYKCDGRTHVALSVAPHQHGKRQQRARGAGRPKASATRSSARSGDSGDSEGSEPPGRTCACGCCESIDHRPPQARYLNDQHAAADRQRRRRTRARDWSPAVSRRDPYFRFDVPTFEQLRQRIERGCRCNGHHIADAEDGHCVKCGHRRGWSMPKGYKNASPARSAETRRARGVIA